MNRIIMLILFTVTLMGCQSRDEKTANKETHQPADTSSVQDMEHKSNSEDELQLNNGSKWKLDEKTRENIGLIRQTIMDSAASPSVIPQLRKQTDKLVSDCRMEGKAHEALHLWLTEFLEHLKEAGNKEESKEEKGVARLKKDIEKFDRFFE